MNTRYVVEFEMPSTTGGPPVWINIPSPTDDMGALHAYNSWIKLHPDFASRYRLVREDVTRTVIRPEPIPVPFTPCGA